MAQVKIYGLREHLRPIREELSAAVHRCVVEALGLPIDKKAHRFFYFDSGDMTFPASASARYTIIEMVMIEGRSLETKKRLIRLLYETLPTNTGLAVSDIEICIMDNPAYNWGFRGMTGDEVKLSYKVQV